MNDLKFEYDYLVLSGGGVRGISLIGALELLSEHGCLNQVHTYVGSSIGALASATFAIGYTSQELIDAISNLDVTRLHDIDLWKLSTDFGLDSGDRLKDFIKSLFKTKGIDPDITFQQFKTLIGKRLVVTGTCINQHTIKYFDDIRSPEVSVIDAIRISMSVPFVFTSPRHNGEWYTDGGLLDNFPLNGISQYLKGDERVIAIKLGDSKAGTEQITDLEQWSLNLVSTLLDEIAHLREELFKLRQHFGHDDPRLTMVTIETGNFHAVQLDISQQQKHQLYNYGRYSVARWIEKEINKKIEDTNETVSQEVL